MLNENFILMRIKPYLNENHELSEFEFFELFSDLTLHEQYEVIKIMINNNIDYVEEKEEEKKALEKADLLNTSKSVNDYNDYTKLRNLNNEELCVMAQDGDKTALTALVDKNKRFVYQMAMKMHNQFSHSDFEVTELFQEGCLGLMEAVKHFNVSMDYRFITYCWSWVRQRMSRSVIDCGYTIRIPVHVFEKIQAIQNFRKIYPNDDVHQLLEHYNESHQDQKLSQDDFYKLIAIEEHYLDTTSLNILVGEEGNTELSEFIPDESSLSIEDTVIQDVAMIELKKAFSILKPREKDVLCLRFGLFGDKPKTLEEIGAMYDVTRERIRQIESKALSKLKKSKAIVCLWENYQNE